MWQKSACNQVDCFTQQCKAIRQLVHCALMIFACLCSTHFPVCEMTIHACSIRSTILFFYHLLFLLFFSFSLSRLLLLFLLLSYQEIVMKNKKLVQIIIHKYYATNVNALTLIYLIPSDAFIVLHVADTYSTECVTSIFSSCYEFIVHCVLGVVKLVQVDFRTGKVTEFTHFSTIAALINCLASAVLF